jgi:hypothetical protein
MESIAMASQSQREQGFMLMHNDDTAGFGEALG